MKVAQVGHLWATGYTVRPGVTYWWPYPDRETAEEVAEAWHRPPKPPVPGKAKKHRDRWNLLVTREGEESEYFSFETKAARDAAWKAVDVVHHNAYRDTLYILGRLEEEDRAS